MPSSRVPVFLDTSYVYALVNRNDDWHRPALAWQEWAVTLDHPMVTTEYILTEIGDGLASIRYRREAVRLIELFRESEVVETISASRLFEDALALYRTRPDKAWGMTDCASFVAMGLRGLSSALTADTHFRQAGFRPLLLEHPPA